MGQRQLNRLSARTVETARSPGLYCDGGGLYLQISTGGTKSWIFRYRSPVSGKLRYMGLGSYPDVPLATQPNPAVPAERIMGARERAAAQRAILTSGVDPIDARDEESRRRAMNAAKAMTFKQCGTAYIDSHKAGWSNEKHTEQWTNTIETYAGPVIGALPVQAVDTGLVLKVLEPIWSKKPETATRLRGRIERVLDWARVRGYRAGENPARWRGHLDHLLPALAKKSRVVHHQAMPFAEVPGLVGKLREATGTAARCLEFVILTAARTGEAIYAKPSEFDLGNAIWTVPASRMKAKREHRVPLSPRAVAIVREMLELGGEHVFPGYKVGKPLSNMTMLGALRRLAAGFTVHGFRSSFRDWAAERTHHQHEVCEMALAHTIANAAEAAYRRGDLFEKRRRLMDAWAEYLIAPQQEGTVIPFKSAA
jgi:integrase